MVNQLHAIFRDLLPGGARTDLRATAAAAVLRTVRLAPPVERTRKALARDLVCALRGARRQPRRHRRPHRRPHDRSARRLRQPAGRGRRDRARARRSADRPHRPGLEVPQPDAFASYAGAAPIEVSSGKHNRHRLSRSGDRPPNSALHLIAVTQVRMPGSIGRRYFDRKIAEGKTRNEAMRCLKRRIAAHARLLRCSAANHLTGLGDLADSSSGAQRATSLSRLNTRRALPER